MVVEKGYKMTEVGVIPEDWEFQNIRQLGHLKNGINKSANDFGYGNPFINLMDVFGKSVIGTETELGLVNSSPAEISTYNLKCGDVLFIRSSVKPSGVGLTVLIADDLENTVYSGFMIRFRDNGSLIKEFKIFCFHEEGFRKRLISNSTVSANTNINQDALKNLYIAYPLNKKEQTAIAEALSDMDALIAQTEQLIEKKKAIKQGMMQELLTGKTRLSGFGVNKGYKMTEVGMIPEDWEVISLGQIGKFSKGAGVRKDEANRGDIPCIRYGEIYTKHNDYIKYFYSYISESVALTSKRIKCGDILFAGSGETKVDIGKAVAFLDSIEAYAGSDMVILSPMDSDSMFLGYLLNSPVIQKQKAQKGQGDVIVHINEKQLSSIIIPHPPLIEQTAIAKALSDMDYEIALAENKANKLKQHKQGMMQSLLTGKIRLV
jgi:type I restriction enzyme S subunit